MRRAQNRFGRALEKLDYEHSPILAGSMTEVLVFKKPSDDNESVPAGVLNEKLA